MVVNSLWFLNADVDEVYCANKLFSQHILVSKFPIISNEYTYLGYLTEQELKDYFNSNCKIGYLRNCKALLDKPKEFFETPDKKYLLQSLHNATKFCKNKVIKKLIKYIE